MSERLLTAADWGAMMREPLKDQAYRATGLGPAVTDFLAWKRPTGRQRKRSTRMSAISPAPASSTPRRRSRR